MLNQYVNEMMVAIFRDNPLETVKKQLKIACSPKTEAFVSWQF